MRERRVVGPAGENAALTGLRGVAAVWVMVHHLTNSGSSLGSGFHVAFGQAYLAVDLFFVLSGYVIAMANGADFTASTRPSDLFRFACKRVGRIYPLYAMAFAMSVAEASLGALASVGPVAMLANAFLVQQWFELPSLDGPAWSVSAEMLAYLCFPWTVRVLHGMPRSMLVIASLVLALFYAGYVMSISDPGVDGHAHLTRCALGFTLGVATYLSGLGAWRCHRAVNVAIAVAMVLAAAVPCGGGAFVLLSPVLVATLRTGFGPVARFLSSPPVHWLGKVSYSVYILHWLTGPLFRIAPSHQSVGILASMVVVLGMSALTHRYVEVPGRSLVLRLASRSARGAAQVAA